MRLPASTSPTKKTAGKEAEAVRPIRDETERRIKTLIAEIDTKYAN
jgi:hypothetical protein